MFPAAAALVSADWAAVTSTLPHSLPAAGHTLLFLQLTMTHKSLIFTINYSSLDCTLLYCRLGHLFKVDSSNRTDLWEWEWELHQGNISVEVYPDRLQQNSVNRTLYSHTL